MLTHSIIEQYCLSLRAGSTLLGRPVGIYADWRERWTRTRHAISSGDSWTNQLDKPPPGLSTGTLTPLGTYHRSTRTHAGILYAGTAWETNHGCWDLPPQLLWIYTLSCELRLGVFKDVQNRWTCGASGCNARALDACLWATADMPAAYKQPYLPSNKLQHLLLQAGHCWLWDRRACCPCT